MGNVEIELWTDQDQPDYARIFADLNDTVAENLYNHLWDIALEWTETNEKNPEVYKRLTGRHVEIAEVLNWYKEEGFIECREDSGTIVFIPKPSVQEALQTNAKNRTVLYED